MFLSQLALQSRSALVQRDLRDSYQLHKTLSRAWGEGEEYERARVLFRVEDAQRGGVAVLVQSQIAPDWSRLPDGYLADEAQCKEWLPQICDGQILSFRLRANPTVKRDGKRCGLYLEDQRISWIERKASTSGFALCAVRVRDEGRDRTQVLEEKTVRVRQVTAKIGGQMSAFSAARFDGTLRVTDAAAFVKALESGIGSGKGLGFGLLSLARG